LTVFWCFQSERLHQVLEYVNEVHSLCGVLAVDFGKTVDEIHPSLHDPSLDKSTSISDSTLEGLARAIQKLKTEKKVRTQKVSCPTHSHLSCLVLSFYLRITYRSSIVARNCWKTIRIVEPDGFISRREEPFREIYQNPWIIRCHTGWSSSARNN